ncbi:unnamed protein product [Brassica oleracea]
MLARLFHRLMVHDAGSIKSFPGGFLFLTFWGGTCDCKGGSNLIDKGLNLSGSWQQGHSATYNTPSHVPPQPNSPPDNVLRPDRQAEASLGSKRRGCYPASDSQTNSTGSSFPADSAKPVPLAVVSLDSGQGYWESLGFPVSVPVMSWLFDARRKLPKEPFLVCPPTDTRRSVLGTLAAQAARQQSTGSELGPLSPALIANPFPKVTDLFCRLPLPTLFHRPEAVHL